MRLTSADHAAEIARAIDARFANSSAETKTGTEKAFAQAFANQTGDIGAIVTAIGITVFFTMLLVSANTMAQSVRERTNELMVLKTLGFSDAVVLALVIGESLLLTVLGGALGTLLAMLLIGRLSRSLGQYLSSFLLTPASYALAVALMLALGFAAGIFPAARASRLKIVDGLARH
jgi:putative ABC transport system permease protein